MREYEQLCNQYNLPCARQTTKQRWTKLVNAAIFDWNRLQLLQDIKAKFIKLDYDTLKDEKYEMKEYMKKLNMNNARMKFRIRTKMVENIGFNFSSDNKYASRLWQCSHCENIDSQSHVLVCVGFKHLREGKDLKSDKDLVNYFREVISLRDKIDNIL